MNALEKRGKVIAYVDGASSNNQNAELRCGGWAVVLLLMAENGTIAAKKELAGKVVGATNNQMELEAIRQCLLALKKDKVDIEIVSDSQYAIGVLSQGHNANKNRELIVETKALIARHNVKFVKIAGHTGQKYNERADTLAVEASKS